MVSFRDNEHSTDKIYLVGGITTLDGVDRHQILQYQCAEGGDCLWREIEARLKYGRSGHVVWPLTDELAKEFCYCVRPNIDGDPGPKGNGYYVRRIAEYYQCDYQYLGRYLKPNTRYEHALYEG